MHFSHFILYLLEKPAENLQDLPVKLLKACFYSMPLNTLYNSLSMLDRDFLETGVRSVSECNKL